MTSMPDTSLYRTVDLTFAAGGLSMKPDQPMRTWKINYSGKMKYIFYLFQKQHDDYRIQSILRIQMLYSNIWYGQLLPKLTKFINAII